VPVGILLGSVLVHERGHAFAMETPVGRRGRRPEIGQAERPANVRQYVTTRATRLLEPPCGVGPPEYLARFGIDRRHVGFLEDLRRGIPLPDLGHESEPCSLT